MCEILVFRPLLIVEYISGGICFSCTLAREKKKKSKKSTRKLWGWGAEKITVKRKFNGRVWEDVCMFHNEVSRDADYSSRLRVGFGLGVSLSVSNML